MGPLNAAYEHRKGPHPDLRLAGLAAEQHAVVSHEQLNALGIRGSAVTRRIATGRLHRRHRGVYAVGQPRLTREGRWLAAVLASGPGAVLSHRDAAALWGLTDVTPARIDVTTEQRTRTGVAGVRLHRVRALPAEERRRKSAIPATTVARTLVDLTDVLGRERLTRVVREADFLGLLDLEALDACLYRAHGRRRLGVLRGVLEQHRPGIVVRSELEHRFLELCYEAGLPPPEMNVRMTVRGKLYEFDCFWPADGVIVELDGRSTHDTARAFEADRARDAALVAAGLRPLRYTWRRIRDDRRRVIAELRDICQPSAPSSRSMRRRIASEEA